MTITFDFTGRTVLVTGAAQGIGFAIATMFHDSGADVVVVDRNRDALVDAWEAAADRVLAVDGDVASADDARRFVDAAMEWTGRLDVVVNNAGITRDTVVWKMDDDQWRAVIDVHLTGTFNLTRASIPVMRAAGRGRIVNVTSYTGLRGNIGQANYAAAKAGIIGFTKTVAKEVARFGITVNAISPNAETPMVAAVPPDKKEALTAAIPAGRFGTAEEMAAPVGFLASDEADYITGIVLPIDGGLTM